MSKLKSHRTKFNHKRKHHNHSRLIYNQAYNESLDHAYPFRHCCSVKHECYDYEDDYWVVTRSTGWKSHKYRKQWMQHVA